MNASKLALLALPLLLPVAGCASGTSPITTPAASYDVAGDTPRALADRYLDAVEAADADGIRASFLTNRDFMAREVDLQARSLAAFRTVWLRLVDTFGEGEARAVLLRSGFEGVIPDPNKDPFELMRDYLDAFDDRQLTLQMVATDDGWYFDRTLPEPGAYTGEAEAILNRTAFTLGDNTAILLFMSWVNEQLDAGVTDSTALSAKAVEADPPANLETVLSDTRFVLAGIRDEAEGRGLSELASNIEASIEELDQNARDGGLLLDESATRPAAAQPATLPTSQPTTRP